MKKGPILLVLFMLLVGLLGCKNIENIQKINPDAARKKALSAACKVNIRQVESALENYYAQNEDYPDTLGQLVDAGYLDEVPKCPLSSERKEYIYDPQTGKVTAPKNP